MASTSTTTANKVRFANCIKGLAFLPLFPFPGCTQGFVLDFFWSCLIQEHNEYVVILLLAVAMVVFLSGGGGN